MAGSTPRSTKIAPRPEMPKKMELTGTEIKKLAEIKMEYPTKKQKNENQEQQNEPSEAGAPEIHNCIYCEETFPGRRKKRWRRNQNQECQQVPRKEEWAYECPECNRNPISRSCTSKHQQFVFSNTGETAAEEKQGKTHHSGVDNEEEGPRWHMGEGDLEEEANPTQTQEQESCTPHILTKGKGIPKIPRENTDKRSELLTLNVLNKRWGAYNEGKNARWETQKEQEHTERDAPGSGRRKKMNKRNA